MVGLNPLSPVWMDSARHALREARTSKVRSVLRAHYMSQYYHARWISASESESSFWEGKMDAHIEYSRRLREDYS